MIPWDILKETSQETPSKIVMLVADGLGGLKHPATRKSELETAAIPNLDLIAKESTCGLTVPVLPGITPGSGPGHLALFGYDPLEYQIGRGVLEALGIGVELEPNHIAARGNFCTVDSEGNLIDRRAGRISSVETIPLCSILNDIEIPGFDLSVYPVQDYRFVLVMRSPEASPDLTETDPQRINLPALKVGYLTDAAIPTAVAANEFVAEASRRLANQTAANMVLLRGFSRLPSFPSIKDLYRLNAAAIAAYPMYRGLAEIVGMKVIPTGTTFDQEIDTIVQHYNEHDFFYIHYKPADAAGEDGDFEAKVAALETLDSYLPRILELDPDVLIVAGDHSTPALLAGHSWHPVPFMLRSKWTRGEGIDSFTEANCSSGSLGTFPATNIMTIAMAHAGKLLKFGP